MNDIQSLYHVIHLSNPVHKKDLSTMRCNNTTSGVTTTLYEVVSTLIVTEVEAELAFEVPTGM